VRAAWEEARALRPGAPAPLAVLHAVTAWTRRQLAGAPDPMRGIAAPEALTWLQQVGERRPDEVLDPGPETVRDRSAA
jgi:hypothetical protein